MWSWLTCTLVRHIFPTGMRVSGACRITWWHDSLITWSNMRRDPENHVDFRVRLSLVFYKIVDPHANSIHLMNRRYGNGHRNNERSEFQHSRKWLRLVRVSISTVHTSSRARKCCNFSQKRATPARRLPWWVSLVERKRVWIIGTPPSKWYVYVQYIL